MRMTSVVCNVPVLSQNDSISIYHHSVFTTWKWHPFATWTPSFIILVWGHHPPPRCAVPYLPASRTLVKSLKRRSVNKFRHRYSMLWPLNNNNNKFISSRQVQSVKQTEYEQRVLIIAYRRLPGSSTSWAECCSTDGWLSQHKLGFLFNIY